MRRDWRVKAALVCGLAAVGVLMVFASKQAEARPKYYSSFQKKYPEVVKENDVLEKVKCNACHIGQPKAKKWNAYGVALRTALENELGGKDKIGKAGVLDVKVIEAALKKTEEAKSEIEGKTFGDLLKEKKLPAKVGKDEKKAE